MGKVGGGGSIPERSSGRRPQVAAKSPCDLWSRNSPPAQTHPRTNSKVKDKEKRLPVGSLTVISKNYQIARVTLPERKQRVQA